VFSLNVDARDDGVEHEQRATAWAINGEQTRRHLGKLAHPRPLERGPPNAEIKPALDRIQQAA